MAELGALLIRDPGPATSVQDFGRLDMRRLGIPVAGTLCTDWLRMGNCLLGNKPGAAALEFRLLGPRFSVEVSTLHLLVAGPAEMKIDSAGETRQVPPWTMTEVRRGDVVALGPVQVGTVALLCVAGGVCVPQVLGSRATYTRAGLGGFKGRALEPGDQIPVEASAGLEMQALNIKEETSSVPIRVVLGPQDDHFLPSTLQSFLSRPFTVTAQTDRMGMRLEGPVLSHRSAEEKEIVSDGIVPGAIQIPGNGHPIVLLADGQTVGGYPKIATVISADLPRLSRLPPGAQVFFEAADVLEAEEALYHAIRQEQKILSGAHPAIPPGAVDVRKLYESNLISGVTCGSSVT